VTLTGNGGIYTRIGRLAGGAADAIALLGGPATARVLSGSSWQTRGVNIQADAAYSPNLTAVVNGNTGGWSAINAWSSQQVQFFNSLSTLAQNILITQVQLDASLLRSNLTTAMTELIRQMRVASASINASTVAAGAQATVSAVGNPVFVAGLLNARGDTVQTPNPETIRFTCLKDQNTGGTVREEPFSAVGAAPANVWAYNWPQGSGASIGVTLTDSQMDNSGGNALVNGSFDTFNSNYPGNWVLGAAGVIGTDILAGGANSYAGTNCLKFLGDGATHSTIFQPFNTPVSATNGAGGTPFKVLPSTTYAVNLFSKSPVPPAAGVLRVALVDSTNTVIDNDAGGACSFTVDLTALTTSYEPFSATFATPTNLPGAVRLELKLTTPITSTDIVYVSDLAMTPAASMYVGGPTLAGFAGNVPVVKGDAFTIGITATYGLLAIWLERFFGLRSKALIVPYSGSPTIADSLVS
jgi:hypothetical protein